MLDKPLRQGRYISTKERQISNRKLFRDLCNAGVAVHVCIEKRSITSAWEKLDIAITAYERDGIIAEYAKKHSGREPVMVGSTRDWSKISAILKTNPDLTPGICGGLNEFIVIDPDAKDNGPEFLAKWLVEQNEVIPAGCPITRTPGGGNHIFFGAIDDHGNEAGVLKSLGCDVRGSRGYVMAPGTILADGGIYAPVGPVGFREAFSLKTLPRLPAFLDKAIKVAVPKKSAPIEVDYEALIAEYKNQPLESAETLIDTFNLDSLAKRDETFAAIVSDATNGDCSDNRFGLIRALRRHEPSANISFSDYAVLAQHYEACGKFTGDRKPERHEFDFRQLAREYGKTTTGNTTGKAFGDVSDSAEADNLPDHYLKAKEARERQKAGEQPPADTKPRLSLIQLDNEAVETWQPVEWIIDGYIPRGCLGIAFGPPDSKKSFVLIDVVSHVVRGTEWFGNRVEKAGAIYWFGEGRQGIAGRFKAWAQTHDTEGGAVGLSDYTVNFHGDYKTLLKTLRHMAEDYESAAKQRCELMVFDTLSKATLGINENDNAEVAQALRNAELAAKRLNATIIFVAHTGKDGSRGVRGASALEGNVDFRLEFRDGQLIVERMKDAAKREAISYSTKSVEIGVNRYGDPITSLVVTRGSASGDVTSDRRTANRRSTKRRCDLPASQAAVLGAIEAWGRREAERQGKTAAEIDVPLMDARAELNLMRLKPMNDATFASAKRRLVRSGLISDAQRGMVRLAGSEYGFPCDDD